MSRERREQAKFDRWTDVVFRANEAREHRATWSRHLVTRDGSVRPLLHADFVPPDAQVYWVGDYPTERNGWISWTPPSVGIREDAFVHPSWARPGPSPRTRRQRKAGR